jgi:hypothetical protein
MDGMVRRVTSTRVSTLQSLGAGGTVGQHAGHESQKQSHRESLGGAFPILLIGCIVNTAEV